MEGAVAGFLYDLMDASSDPNGSNNQSTGADDDSVSFPGSYVAEVMGTCQTDGLTQLDGTDQFIYCAEESLEAEDAAAPFSNQWRSFSTFSINAETPSGWSQQVIRDLWLHNLYDG